MTTQKGLTDLTVPIVMTTQKGLTDLTVPIVMTTQKGHSPSFPNCLVGNPSNAVFAISRRERSNLAVS